MLMVESGKKIPPLAGNGNGGHPPVYRPPVLVLQYQFNPGRALTVAATGFASYQAFDFLFSREHERRPLAHDMPPLVKQQEMQHPFPKRAFRETRGPPPSHASA